MTYVGQYLAFVLVLTSVVEPLGAYVERVFSRQKTLLDPVCAPLERLIYRLARVDAGRAMPAAEYAASFLALGAAGTLVLYCLLRLQRFLPWFMPAFQTTGPAPDLSLNTALSFTTTTTWQAYAGESTMSYFSQLVGLGVQNFLGAAAGLSIGIAFIRSFATDESATIGNFWVDTIRGLLWILLPGALIGAIVLAWQGVPMNFSDYSRAMSLEGARQAIAQGPVAAFEIIKNLGTNGGGFFNVNGAHPFENPTPLSNVVEMLAIVLLPAALTNTFGRMVKQPRQGWVLYLVMLALFVAGLTAVHAAEQAHMGHLGNMEGKEVRFGVGGSALTSVVVSNTATGSYNAMHDSFTPIGGMVLLVNMLLGEVVFGGLGTGLISMVMAALIAVFLAGLMIGRTPEYLGKKIGPIENKMIVIYAVIAPIVVLPLTAVALSLRAGLAGLAVNDGPHGLTTVVFAYASSFGNNGQTFAGLNANTPFYNLTTALAMFAGRYGLAVPALTLAGLFVRQKRSPRTAGSLRTDSVAFALLLAASLIVVAGLSHLPVLTLGPVLEHLRMSAGL
jgi:K+-transporting ATPase ATPase A chain